MRIKCRSANKKQNQNVEPSATDKFRIAPVLTRETRELAAKSANIIAYDYETTRIQPGTPRPLYITAFARNLIHFANSINTLKHLQAILRSEFLIDEFQGFKFVAWNANNFDAYFTAAALVTCEDLVLRPYLTRNKALRGLRVIKRSDINNNKAKGWEFLDGIAMLGLVGVSLEKFLNNFAPEHPKLTGAIDFEHEEFDISNQIHRNYAMQDSIGLWHGLQRAQSILIEKFNQPLTVTMGGACIKIFKANIPRDTTIPTPKPEVLRLVRDYVMRGGFCYCARRYQGPIWKYDINQAYAAAMREAKLPCGFTQHCKSLPESGVYIARITATNPANRIPFYYRSSNAAEKICSFFSDTRIENTWLTSIEIEQLQREHWEIEIFESYAWQSTFSMVDYVDQLEIGRSRCEGGPSGPIGTMYKMVGNHSYGKTVEQIDPLEFVIANKCPEGYTPFYENNGVPIDHIFYRFVEDQRAKNYHQPQLGAFITAHVRMVVRRAALLNPQAWLYADTDCVVFAADVTDRLDIDAKRYGAWKIEESGAEYQIIAKKVYAQLNGSKRSAKGLHVKKLDANDFQEWFDGTPPVQTQVQRQNFLAVLQGAEMFRAQIRHGTAVEKLRVS